MKLEPLTIARHDHIGQQFKFFILGLVTIYEGLVMTLSLGFLDTNARAKVIFSKWFMGE